MLYPDFVLAGTPSSSHPSLPPKLPTLPPKLPTVLFSSAGRRSTLLGTTCPHTSSARHPSMPQPPSEVLAVQVTSTLGRRQALRGPRDAHIPWLSSSCPSPLHTTMAVVKLPEFLSTRPWRTQHPQGMVFSARSRARPAEHVPASPMRGSSNEEEEGACGNPATPCSCAQHAGGSLHPQLGGSATMADDL